MKKYLILFGATLTGGLLQSQISVYECTPENSIVTHQELVQDPAQIYKSCAVLSNDNFMGNHIKVINAKEEIEITGEFEAKPNSGSNGGYLELKVNKGDFDVFCMNYPDLLHVLKYKKLEFGITLPENVQQKVDNFISKASVPNEQRLNPYMDWDIRVAFVFTHPQIPYSISIDGFYNKEYDSWMTPESDIPEFDTPVPFDQLENFFGNTGVYNSLGGYTEVPSDYPFLCRFSPPRTGKWGCTANIYLANNQIYSSDPFYFTVIESDNPGYVKVANDSRSLELGGQPFYPVGANILWPMTYKTQFNDGTASPKLQKLLTNSDHIFVSEEYKSLHPLPVLYDYYRNLIRNMADGGANCVRLIMHPLSIDIEFEELGNYTNRLYQAQELDEVLEYCESRNVYIDWNMMIHYVHQYNNYNVGWQTILEGKPYAYKSIAGINNNPENFFTNEEAKAYYKQRLRYILARWGYSTNVAMFELYSEIGDQNTSLTKANINYQWQSEMAAYIKERANGITHIVQPSYAGLKVKDDHTFLNPKIDVMTTNLYSGLKTYARNWIDLIQEDFLDQSPVLNTTLSYSMHCEQTASTPGQPYFCIKNTKPFFLSEYNANSELCDNAQIETKRAMWQIQFSGAVGALSWYAYQNGIVYPEFSKIRAFMENMNDKGFWHPGAMQMQNDGRIEFKSTWADDMDKTSKKADLIYMRSNDKNYAIGVITNKTYNIVTGDGCIPSLPGNLSHLALAETIDTRTEDIFLNGMKNNQDYHIDYFHLYDLSTPFQSETVAGSRIKLKTSVGMTYDDYIVLVLARKTNAPLWLPKQEEIIELIGNTMTLDTVEKTKFREMSETSSKDLEIDVYPIPATDLISINLNDIENNVTLVIVSTEGKEVKSVVLDEKLNEIDILDLGRGVYELKFYQGETIIQHKKIVKL